MTEKLSVENKTKTQPPSHFICLYPQSNAAQNISKAWSPHLFKGNWYSWQFSGHLFQARPGRKFFPFRVAPFLEANICSDVTDKSELFQLHIFISKHLSLCCNGDLVSCCSYHFVREDSVQVLYTIVIKCVLHKSKILYVLEILIILSISNDHPDFVTTVYVKYHINQKRNTHQLYLFVTCSLPMLITIYNIYPKFSNRVVFMSKV